MWYARVTNVSPLETRRQVEDALQLQGLTLDNLIDKLGYVTFQKGRDRFARLYSGEADDQLLRRVANLLQIDLEQLSGERPFDREEEYRRFTFAPYLVRIPERTTPSQIFPVAFAGIDRFLRVGVYPQLLDAPRDVQDELVRREILQDYEKQGATFFGATIGYAFYHAYGEARAYSIAGEETPGLSVIGHNAQAYLTTGSKTLTGAKGEIPRLVPTA